MTTRTEQELASVAVNAAHALQDERRHYEIACGEIANLRTRVEALLAERHTTNESLDDAVKAIRTKDQRIAELEKQLAKARDDRDAEIIAWLCKKAREYEHQRRLPRHACEEASDVLGRMADKISRGAVRPESGESR